MRARRQVGCWLALSLVGCHAVTYDLKQTVVGRERRELGRDTAPLVRVGHHATRDDLALTVGDLVTVEAEDVTHHARTREWELAYYSLTDQTGSEDDFSLTLLLLPITLPIDLLLPVLSLIVLPFRLALGEGTAEWSTRAPVTSKEERPWASYELVDPAADVRVPVRAGEPLRAGDLALQGVRSTELVAVGPGGLTRDVTLPPSAAATIAAVHSARGQVPAGRLVRVAPGEALLPVLRGAPPGTWIQLEEGVYDLPSGSFLFGKRLTLAGRGAARTVLRGPSGGLDLRGASQDVTLRGLSVALEGTGVSDGVRCHGGVVRLIGCEVRGARHEKVPPPPDAPPGQGDAYRGGVGVSARGGGKVVLEACRLVDNQTAGVLASGDHEVVVVGCVGETGALEAFSFRGASRGAVRDAVARGPGHGVLVGDEARVTVARCEVQVARAGVLVNGTATATVEGNTLEGCATGVSVEDASIATVTGNVCRGNQTGVLVDSRGRVEVARNTCVKNKTNGISVQGEAKPVVTGNTCEGNPTGILFTGKAGGRAAGNTLRGNGAGVAAQDEARPAIVSNQVTGSTQAGISVGGSAAPTINGNTCSGGLEGLHVEGSARPEVYDNTFEKNHRGAVFLGQSGGSFTGNRVTNNTGPGVVNQSGGGPRIQHNTVSGNNPNTSS
ncbi:MAG: right-handed parallel beta-helix repeat-containing protein [Planctomycetes bacterium]|nr:right-handed parallel beta-helix repeat-containing protein [Planctomycetota bacterium]